MERCFIECQQITSNKCDNVEDIGRHLVPQRSDSLRCRNLLEGDGKGVACVPVWVGPYQAAHLH